MSKPTEEELLIIHEAKERVDKAIASLQEHFASVQVFATFPNYTTDGGGTFSIQRGSGDFFARYGLAAMWVKDQKLGD